MLSLRWQGQSLIRSMSSSLRFDTSPPIVQILLEQGQTWSQTIKFQIFVRFASIILTMKMLGCLGAGSFGKVYKVEVGGELYALKKVGLEFECTEESDEMISLKNEVALLAECLYHPNVVRYYSSFRKQDSFFIVMEYAGHLSLNDIPMPLANQPQIVNLTIQLAMGLKHLHHNRILHRDIKPNNILISPTGLLKIADFGISKQIPSLAQANTCLGTPFYAAPEIIDQLSYDFPVDVWSFGVVLYECTHGRLPFIASNMSDLKRKIRLSTPQIRQDLHKDLRLILRGCLAKHPSNRITIDQILKVPLIQNQMTEEIANFLTYF